MFTNCQEGKRRREMSRIELNDSIMDMVVKMAEGNPGAINAMMNLIQENESIDPDDCFGPFGKFMLLDTFEIYGTDIYVLYSDICSQQINKMISTLRACQLGFLSPSILKDVSSRQDYSGKNMIDVENLYNKVKEHLPKFDN
jgi:hypothetical protein